MTLAKKVVLPLYLLPSLSLWTDTRQEATWRKRTSYCRKVWGDTFRKGRDRVYVYGCTRRVRLLAYILAWGGGEGEREPIYHMCLGFNPQGLPSSLPSSSLKPFPQRFHSLQISTTSWRQSSKAWTSGDEFIVEPSHHQAVAQLREYASVNT